MVLPRFPTANQAQIIRAHQRDLIQVSTLREDAENALRSWLGTRWLTQWEKELDLIVRLVYYGLTTGRGIQTLGEEYTDIWARSKRPWRLPRERLRIALVLLPAIMSYALTRLRLPLTPRPLSWLSPYITHIPGALGFLSELNLAIFYLRGAYYHSIKRLLGIRYISSLPENPKIRPPSYALLGILLFSRLIYRFIKVLRPLRSKFLSPLYPDRLNSKAQIQSVADSVYIDFNPISSIIASLHQPESDSMFKDPAQDSHTHLSISSLPKSVRDARKCALCLEERTGSTLTECGHIFCWECIVSWGREKAECPLCRQGLELKKLLPIYNL